MSNAVAEMLEPVGGFDSKLEWLAYWLDGTDELMRKFAELHNDDILKEAYSGTEVQNDLRRWAQELREDGL